MQQTSVVYNGQSFDELTRAAHGLPLGQFLDSRGWQQVLGRGHEYWHDCATPSCTGTVSVTADGDGRNLVCSAACAASGEFVMTLLHEPPVVRANGHDHSAPVAPLLDPSDPLGIARAFHNYYGGPLRCQQGAFVCYDGVRYAPVEPARLREALYAFLDTATKPGMEGPVPFKPTVRKINEILDALASACFLGAEITSPSWIEFPTEPWPASEIIACQNGLLHLPTATLFPSTSALFITNALEFDYDPDAPEPAAWLAFLHSLWTTDAKDADGRTIGVTDQQSIDTLQEIMGYLVCGGTEQQKIFMLVGPKRCGKGTIGHILRQLVGRENSIAPTLKSLATNFGLQPLLGKRLAVVGDARLGAAEEQQTLAERLLTISGADALTIPRKYMTDWSGELAVRFVLLTNKLPSIGDASGALASRFIPLVIKNSFYGREDLALGQRLADELPGILKWSIAGWRRLSERGYFSPPAATYEAQAQMERLGSPVIAFVDERCTLGPDNVVAVERLYDAFIGWCRQNGRDRIPPSTQFGADLVAAFPNICKTRPRDRNGARFNQYVGISLD